MNLPSFNQVRMLAGAKAAVVAALLPMWAIPACGGSDASSSSDRSGGDNMPDGSAGDGSFNDDRDLCSADRGPRVVISVSPAGDGGMCPLTVTAEQHGIISELQCSTDEGSAFCECPLDPSEGKLIIEVLHDDGRTGSGELDVTSPDACFTTQVQIDLGEPPQMASGGSTIGPSECDIVCSSSAECPQTSLGKFCITGCCVVED